MRVDNVTPRQPFLFVPPRFTEVRTNGNSTWRTASWTWTGETTSSPKPSGTPSGEGDAGLRHRKKKKKKKKERQTRRSGNSLTPSVLLEDTSVSFHILRLDLFQETSAESLRTLDQTQRTVRYRYSEEKKKKTKNKQKKKSNPGVLERRWAGLAGREDLTEEEKLANRASLSASLFFVLLPGVLCFQLPHTITHRPPESVSFGS